ncbi:zinc-finger homeodomain protein 5-like isoform X2 [Humulus lupulus]|uniref:zinc-finger homeodomain protein 5-like isoform X2 n=1 Tax=Humulus lupulus TaxID=3486 RepID=UPI002B415603|nr:zinc-finger homeodomain protein 5-like isoform X2 [Humulus lupulus]
MEFRAQDNEMRTSPGTLTYNNHLSKEGGGGGGERRSRSANATHNHNHNHNGSTNTMSCTTQTLDTNYPPRLNFQNQPLLHGSRDPDPDRVTTVPMTTTFSPSGASAKSSSKTTSSAIRYRECLKNHAASTGGNVYDGCGEFMPSGEEGSLEALKCAACQCHRNFHRKEIDGESQLYSPSSRRSSSTNATTLMLNALQLPPPLPSPSGFHHHHHHHKYFNHPPPIIQPMNVAFGGGGTESSSEDLNVYGSTAEAAAVPPPPFGSKKRFRTKFTQEQKDKMLEFSEKVGWRFQKQDEEEVERFCAEVGIRRQVLKVWMHNNKSTMMKTKPQDANMVMNDDNMVSSNIDIHQSIDEVTYGC